MSPPPSTSSFRCRASPAPSGPSSGTGADRPYRYPPWEMTAAPAGGVNVMVAEASAVPLE